MQTKNSFYLLNTMIYNVYNYSDFDKMKQNLLLSVRQLIPCCCASIFMVNPDNNDELCDPVCNPHSYIQMERRYPNVKDKDFSNWILLKKQSLVIRASDIMPDEV